MSFIGWLRAGDTWLIERVFEPLAWRIEYYTGKNNFWCARGALLVWLAGFVMAIGWSSGVAILIDALILLLATLAYVRTFVAESLSNPSFVNPERHFNWAIRIGWVVFTLSPPMTVVNLAFLGYATYMYFLACNPLPPAWKEAREKAQQARSALNAGIG